MQGARVAAVQQSTGLVGMELQNKTVQEIGLILDNRGVHPYSRHLETDDDIYNMAADAMPRILETLKDVRANDDYLNYEKIITPEQKKILQDTIDRYFAQHATAQPLTPNSAHALPGSTIVSYNCAGGYDGRAQPSVLCVYGMPPAMMHSRVGCNSHSTALCGHAGAPWHGGACHPITYSAPVGYGDAHAFTCAAPGGAHIYHMCIAHNDLNEAIWRGNLTPIDTYKKTTQTFSVPACHEGTCAAPGGALKEKPIPDDLCMEPNPFLVNPDPNASCSYRETCRHRGTGKFTLSDGTHVPNWPEIMPKLRLFWEEYKNYKVNFVLAGNDGDKLGRMINDVLGVFNEWQNIKHRLEAAKKVMEVKLNNQDIMDLVNRKYLVDMQRESHKVEARLSSDYNYIYRALRRASSETWPQGEAARYMKPGTTQAKIRYKVRLSDDIRALCKEICDELRNGDNDMS